MNRGPLSTAVVLLVLVSATAHADDRLDLALPDLPLFEPSYHLDRGQAYEDRTTAGHVLLLGGGVVRIDDGATAFGTSALAIGRHSDTRIALWRTDLDGDGIRGVHGRHRGLVELRNDYDREGVDETITTSIEHGQARALAPVRLGPGRRETGDLSSETLLRFGSVDKDSVLVGTVRGDLGATHWEAKTAPSIDHETHRSITLGLGIAPSDGELPRGHLDVVRGRVEQQRITARSVATTLDGSPRTIETAGGEVRTAEVGVGSNQMTLYIDHELLMIIDADLGWSWIESDTGARRIADNAFRMHLSTALAWKPEDDATLRRLGFDLARLPSTTADGQRIVGDWRLELYNGIETSKYVLDARGGISWLVPFAGGSAPAATLIRYGAQLSAFARLGRELEAGIYHASSYEPRIAGDPWATPRQWSVETGVMARIRK